MSKLLEAALAYAERGWRVFPLKPREKVPATSDGFKSATTHRPTIIGWWSGNPDYNIGIATGEGSGLFVLDVDDHDGWSCNQALGSLGIELPGTETVETGGGGLQFYFQYPQGSGLTISAGKLGRGLDTRGNGGYVVAPPSIHPSGKPYAWTVNYCPLADVPAELLAKLTIAKAKLAEPIPQEIGENRNSTLTSLGGSMRGRGMTRKEIEASLLVVNESRCSPPLDEAEVRQIARHLGAYEPKRPVTAYALTDLGNAERLADAGNGKLRFCTEREIWFWWDGTRWQEKGGEGKAHVLAHRIARELGTEAEAESDPDKRKAKWLWATKSEGADRLSAMVRVATKLEAIRCSVAEFDADPWLLNCENGTLNLRTGNLLPHDPARMCSRLAPVQYVAGARHPTLDGYLDLVTESDPELIAFLQRCLGYSLTGYVGCEVMFMVLGPGGSGKTTLVEALKEMLGDYGATVAAKTLLARKFDSGHSSDVARLHGRRMVGASEFEKGARLDAALIKGLTGGERVTARNIYEADFEFRPMAKFWLAANDPPVIDDNDTGMWRRVFKIPFERVITKRDDGAKERMKTDPDVRSALLAWALQGCLEWQSRGATKEALAAPARVLNATAAYQEESNPLSDFLEECCELGVGHTCTVAEMRAAYGRWFRGQAGKPLSQKDFRTRILKLGVTDNRTNAARGWVGIRLLGSVGDNVTREGPILGSRTF